MLRRNGPGQEFVESVLKEKKTLCWEGFEKQLRFEPGVKE